MNDERRSKLTRAIDTDHTIINFIDLETYETWSVNWPLRWRLPVVGDSVSLPPKAGVGAAVHLVVTGCHFDLINQKQDFELAIFHVTPERNT